MKLRDTGVAALLALLFAAPFLDKAFHIDDTFVLHVTANVLEDPWRPFAGEIDWFGHPRPVWEATTNPPLVSYLLAPFAFLSDYSERALHAVMSAFLVLLAVSLLALARRFTARSWLPLLYVLGSCGVLVSLNVMRDVPALALSTAGITLFLSGVDRERHGRAAAGALLAGLAVLAKYSAVMAVPLLLIYPWLKGRYRFLPWVLVSLLPLSLWCLQNWMVEGRLHVAYLLAERRSVAGIPWPDKWFGALAIAGSLLYLFPFLLWRLFQGRHWPAVAGLVPVTLLMLWGARSFYDAEPDLEFLFWTSAGTVLLATALYEGLRHGGWRFGPRSDLQTDSWFLAAWVFGPVLFSVFFVPFQAVRHLLPALPPLVLLGFRFWDQGSREARGTAPLAAGLAVQLGLTFLVAWADYEYAGSYRRLAEKARQLESAGGTRAWYVGHWGWKFYADRAGFHQLHRDGPRPRPGELLLWPEYVHIGDVFSRDPEWRDRLELVQAFPCWGSLPLRTMSRPERAGFYAVIRRRIPYRLSSRTPLETLRIYRVPPSLPVDEDQVPPVNQPVEDVAEDEDGIGPVNGVRQ